ncbi:malate dehydrogenase [Ophiostoma piceae UAMH 11346]|uniref:Malate dehydrogenase n=1 Tax=Ophiostoma piceae (strain UAMH 11346) TaxID=1262450 RepID=S3CQ41_OPHP1|nr:malate dehydrogenase [Ophiostoma piceae UAMH 11346]
MSRTLAALTSLLAVASAAAVCKPPKSSNNASIVYTLPTAGSGHELAAPPADVKLLKIAVGHGLQNYTCASSTATAVATGALAVLYDVTGVYPGTVAGLSQDEFDSIAHDALWLASLPLNLVNAAMAQVDATPSGYTAYDASLTDPFVANTPALSLSTITGKAGVPDAPVLGHHFFDHSGIPTFDLFADNGLYGSMSKTDSTTSTYHSDAGPMGTGSVPWLLLSANANGLSNGVKYVYRVVTAGGTAVSCSLVQNGTSNVPYTAQYWFYG